MNDIFSTKSLLKVFEANDIPAPKSFLKDTFFSNNKFFESRVIEVDILNPTARIATHVSDTIGSIDVTREYFETRTYTPALISLETSINPADLALRTFGENTYGGKSLQEKVADLTTESLDELDRLIVRKEELMCKEALFEGGVNIYGEGLNPVRIPYPVINKDILKADFEKPDAKILSSLISAKRAVAANSGKNADIAVLGSDIYTALLANQNILDLLNKTNLNIGSINISNSDLTGATFIGRLAGVDLFACDEFYRDENDKPVPFIPANKILIGSRQAKATMAYGAIYDTDVNFAGALRRVPKSFTVERTGSRVIQLKSRPLPIVHEPQSFVVLTVKETI